MKNNKVSKAHFLIQKALVVYSNKDKSETRSLIEVSHAPTFALSPNDKRKHKNLFIDQVICLVFYCQEASALIQKAEVEEKKLYVSSNPKSPAGKDRTLAEDKDNPPPPPVLLSRTHRSFTFVPAPYHMEEHVSLCLHFYHVPPRVFLSKMFLIICTVSVIFFLYFWCKACKPVPNENIVIVSE